MKTINKKHTDKSTEQLKDAIDKLARAIGEDFFRSWESQIKHNPGGYLAREAERFMDDVSIEPLKYYYRIRYKGATWGYIVCNRYDELFDYGDILKAGNSKSPARNKARGNVFEDYEIRWTGPKYLR